MHFNWSHGSRAVWIHLLLELTPIHKSIPSLINFNNNQWFALLGVAQILLLHSYSLRNFSQRSLPSVTTSIKSPVAPSILAPEGKIVLLPKAPRTCELWTPTFIIEKPKIWIWIHHASHIMINNKGVMLYLIKSILTISFWGKR